jgi:hypothetical protein
VVSRRINDEYNFFEGLHKSTLFLIILAIIVLCQVRAGLPVLVAELSSRHVLTLYLCTGMDGCTNRNCWSVVLVLITLAIIMDHGCII